MYRQTWFQLVILYPFCKSLNQNFMGSNLIRNSFLNKKNVCAQGYSVEFSCRCSIYLIYLPYQDPLNPIQRMNLVSQKLTKYMIVLQRLLWAGTGISLCFLLFRIFVCLNAFRRLYSDDSPIANKSDLIIRVLGRDG